MSSVDPKHSLFLAAQYAREGKSAQMLQMIDQVMLQGGVPDWLAAANLCVEYGFVTRAQLHYEKVLSTEPNNLGAAAGLARVATDIGQHDRASDVYERLVQQWPDSDTLRRNALVAQQYNPTVSDPARYQQALAWGQWAMARVGGHQPRPAPHARVNGVPRVGVVSADLCQHTVGLFVKDILRELGKHWPVVAYHARQQEDWVSKLIRSTCQWRNVAAMDDVALAKQIRDDEIDILIDLSGHTAGSRLTAFALRPAPVMVSWLGYFATTGLPYIDAVLLDQWHVTPETYQQFIEPIELLPSGRFYYGSVPWAPKEVSEPPFEKNGYITFGCFNNTAKLNPDVFAVWSQILAAVPRSRLVLKWRTFNDAQFSASVRQAFAARAIDPTRIELRGAGFHVDVLKEYADIDIALDPFPFTGGLTSCEALWMGVPVVTWPQGSVVSRQTKAFLSAIGLDDLVAADADDYVRIATRVAYDRQGLKALRASMQGRMQVSTLMDLSASLSGLQQTLLSVQARVLEGSG